MPSRIFGETPAPAHDRGVRAFAASLLIEQRNALGQLLTQARLAVPGHCIPFFCGSQLLGHLLPAHAEQLVTVLDNASLRDTTLRWQPQDASSLERSAQLQTALCKLRDQRLIGAWRNEDFCFWPGPEAQPGAAQNAFVQVERAGFRYLGMMSHAVHINGFTPDGRMWCGQRSNNKATDPGLWDNMTAGGLSAGESLETCAVRELWEEAGLEKVEYGQLQEAGRIRVSRLTPSGWHDEMLHVYNLYVPEGFVPCNQDGEVQGFGCMSAAEVLAGIAKATWTHDAALAVAQGVLFNSDL